MNALVYDSLHSLSQHSTPRSFAKVLPSDPPKLKRWTLVVTLRPFPNDKKAETMSHSIENYFNILTWQASLFRGVNISHSSSNIRDWGGREDASNESSWTGYNINAGCLEVKHFCTRRVFGILPLRVMQEMV